MGNETQRLWKTGRDKKDGLACRAAGCRRRSQGYVLDQERYHPVCGQCAAQLFGEGVQPQPLVILLEEQHGGDLETVARMLGASVEQVESRLAQVPRRPGRPRTTSTDESDSQPLPLGAKSTQESLSSGGPETGGVGSGLTHRSPPFAATEGGHPLLPSKEEAAKALKGFREMVEGQVEGAKEVLACVQHEDFRIESAEDLELAGEYIAEASTTWKRLDDIRKEYLVPYVEHARDVNDIFRLISEVCKDIEATLKRAGEAALWRAMETRESAIREAEAATERGDKYGAHRMMGLARANTWETPANMTLRDELEIIVQDIDKVPAHYKEPVKLTAAKVQAAFRDGVREIPGLLLRTRPRISTKRKDDGTTQTATEAAAG